MEMYDNSYFVQLLNIEKTSQYNDVMALSPNKELFYNFIRTLRCISGKAFAIVDGVMIDTSFT